MVRRFFFKKKFVSMFYSIEPSTLSTFHVVVEPPTTGFGPRLRSP